MHPIQERLLYPRDLLLFPIKVKVLVAPIPIGIGLIRIGRLANQL